jgi:hypothetical protein
MTLPTVFAIDFGGLHHVNPPFGEPPIGIVERRTEDDVAQTVAVGVSMSSRHDGWGTCERSCEAE